MRKIHDLIFKKSLENPMDFFKNNLPEEIKAIVDLSTLKLEIYRARLK
jgi:predicted transposase YdaD